MATRSGSRSSGSTGTGASSNGSTNGAKTNGTAGRATRKKAAPDASPETSGTASRAKRASRAKPAAAASSGTAAGTGTAAASPGKSTGRRRTAAASAAGATARARITSRSIRANAKRPSAETTRPSDTSRRPDMPLGEPTATTVPADDEVMAASNARRALSPDMPRVAWLRTQLQQMEDRQRERLMKAGALTLIAIVFITFVLQNSESVAVTFVVFSLSIRLIWIIFGCALLGGAAGYLIGRPDKSLRALLPQKEKLTGGKRSSRI